MKKSVMQKWVKALRSGKYRQTRGKLKNKKSGAMCCLGVLCDISNIDEWEEYTEMKYLDSDSLLPQDVQEWAGMQNSDGKILGMNDSLAELNDVNRWNFKRIASFIEENYKKL